MYKPKIAKGMSTFVGCEPGEVRLSYLNSVYAKSNYPKLVASGLIEIIPTACDNKYTALGITAKGKEHVKPLERYYARI